MKITLLTVGKTDRDWVRQGLDIYVSRLKHYIPFSIIEIPELKNVSALTKDQIKTREGELILAALSDKALENTASAQDTSRERTRADIFRSVILKLAAL